MLIQLVEAAHDERGGGNYAYGQPGDQTGDEVRLRNATEGEFTLLLRYPDAAMRRRFAEDALEIAMNDHYGYAQYGATTLGGRLGIHEVMKTFDRFKDVDIDCNCDCSSLVGEDLRHNGLSVSLYMRTATEREELAKLGFKEVPYSLENCRLGDICWRNGHTAIIVRAPEGDDEEDEMSFQATLKSSTATQKWANGSGKLRPLPYITVTSLGFRPRTIICQQQGEVLVLSQYVRDQLEDGGYIYVSDRTVGGQCGIAAGSKAYYFNPDASALKIPVEYPNRDYIVKIYA